MSEEDNVTPNELIGYCNEAISEAEAEIHTLYEDYFLSYTDLTFVAGTSEYSLPTDIYADKIRAVIYSNGSLIYPITRIRNHQKFLDIQITQNFATAEEYRYFLINRSSSTGVKLILAPKARDSGILARLWYLRSANRVPALVNELVPAAATDDAVIDIPEFVNFIMACMRGKLFAKENGGTIPQDAAGEIQQQRKMMVDTLTKMIPDDDDTVEWDLTHYREHQ
jgi:hypothetical protein